MRPPADNPYCCRLMFRVDALLYRLRGADVFWSSNTGRLCERMEKGHGVELRSHFPDAWHIAAAKIQNRWRWTRKVLSA